MQSYTVRVATTDYNQFAIVYFKKVYKNQEYFKTTLYGGSSPPPRGPGAWSHCRGRGERPPQPPQILSSVSSQSLWAAREGGPSADPP